MRIHCQNWLNLTSTKINPTVTALPLGGVPLRKRNLTRIDSGHLRYLKSLRGSKTKSEI